MAEEKKAKPAAAKADKPAAKAEKGAKKAAEKSGVADANAGLPEMVEGRTVYRTTPAEFASFLEMTPIV